MDPEIQDRIILGHNQAKLAHFAKKSWEILLRDFSMLNVPYQSAKFEKKNPVTDREI